MSLKSLLALIDQKLEDTFHKKAPDAQKARAKALKTVETAEKQFASTEPARGRKSFKVSNEVVEFNAGYSIGGESPVYIPAERFPDFLKNLKAAIAAGEMDQTLLADEPIVQKASSKRGGPRGVRGPLSPEALAARRAKVAAKKAAAA